MKLVRCGNCGILYAADREMCSGCGLAYDRERDIIGWRESWETGLPSLPSGINPVQYDDWYAWLRSTIESERYPHTMRDIPTQ